MVGMAEKYKYNLLKFRAIKFDSGIDNEYEFNSINRRLFCGKLTGLGVLHEFEEYNGDHRNRLWALKGRIHNELLPFLFGNFEN